MPRYTAEIAPLSTPRGGIVGWGWQTFCDGKPLPRRTVTPFGPVALTRADAIAAARREAITHHHMQTIPAMVELDLDEMPAPTRPRVIIEPRSGVSAEELRSWLERNFQVPGDSDDAFPQFHNRRIVGGNPLINARIRVEEPTTGESHDPS